MQKTRQFKKKKKKGDTNPSKQVLPYIPTSPHALFPLSNLVQSRFDRHEMGKKKYRDFEDSKYNKMLLDEMIKVDMKAA